ncbi:MAG: hypothetical protein ACRCXC_09130 [Legionella sp.]
MDFLTRFHDPEQHPDHRQKITVAFIALLVLILVLLFLIRSCHTNKNKIASTPMLIRKWQRIIVPENSPLRKQIVVQVVQMTKAPHHVVLPGMVEADPTRTVNILPPATGHLIDLNVQLGEDVKQTHVLATMQSAGIAQADADVAKALIVLKQTQEALNRAQKVNKAGGNAVKDIEQTQSNYSQALAEMVRA